MKVERLNEFKNPTAHYEDTIGKDVLSSEEAELMRFPTYRNRGTYTMGLTATFKAVADNYGLGSFIKSKFEDVSEVVVSKTAYGVAHVYYYFNMEMSKQKLIEQAKAISEEVVNFYREHGFELKPTVRDYPDARNGADSHTVLQYFKIISVSKAVIIDANHDLKNYKFETTSEKGVNFSKIELRNMAKRLSNKLNIPVEQIDVFLDDNNMPKYRILK